MIEARIGIRSFKITQLSNRTNYGPKPTNVLHTGKLHPCKPLQF